MANKHRITVGIHSIGYYIPSQILTSDSIAKSAQIELSVITEKIGMKQKHVAAPNEHPSDMGLKAARSALEQASISPEQIDIIAYCGAGHYDYRFWSPAAKIQTQLEADNAFAFEVKNFCNSGNLGINICRHLLLGNPEASYALVICSDTLSRLIDHSDRSAPALLMFADGAAAALLKKNESSNVIHKYCAITDGSLADDVRIDLGGTKKPFTDTSNLQEQYVKVQDNEKLGMILGEIYLKNYLQVINQSLSQSGYGIADIDFLFTNQVKKSLFKEILWNLDLSEENTYISLTQYGHMGAVDTFFCLGKVIENRRLKEGDIVVLASSAAGFSWAALTISF